MIHPVHTVKSKVEISQNFVAFSEYMNFNSFNIFNDKDSWTQQIPEACNQLLSHFLGILSLFWDSRDFERYINPIPIRRGQIISTSVHRLVPIWYENVPTGLFIFVQRNKAFFISFERLESCRWRQVLVNHQTHLSVLRKFLCQCVCPPFPL